MNELAIMQLHVVRALCFLSLSPKFHHVVMSTGVMANTMPMAMTENLPMTLRISAAQIMAAVTATHPTCPTEQDVMDLLSRKQLAEGAGVLGFRGPGVSDAEFLGSKHSKRHQTPRQTPNTL